MSHTLGLVSLRTRIFRTHVFRARVFRARVRDPSILATMFATVFHF